MQQRGRENMPRLNPYAAEFIPMTLGSANEPGLGPYHPENQSFAVRPSAGDASYKTSSKRPDFVHNLFRADLDCCSETFYNRIHNMYNSRPKQKDLMDLSNFCVELRNKGFLTSGLKDFFKEMFCHLNWLGKSPKNGSSVGGQGFDSTYDVFDLSNPRSMHLKLVIVHFAGYGSKFDHGDNSLTVTCQDGAVKANKEILCLHSGYFYQKCMWNANAVNLPFCNKHEMACIKTLLLKGRVVVLKKRLPVFMRLVLLLQIRGVFPSEDCHMDGNKDFFFSKIFAAPSILETVEKLGLESREELPKVLGLPDRVRCLECRNIFDKAMFCSHFEEYHSVLTDHIICCTFFFRTKYEYVHHKNTVCVLANPEADCSNISFIRHHEQSGIAVNLSAVRPYVTTHSTPIDDRV